MSSKAATPARRQTAKKQHKVVKKQRLSSKDREIQRFLRVVMPVRPEAPIPLKQDISVAQLDALADTCERKGYRMRYAGLVVVD
jgi:hypothetical protein